MKERIGRRCYLSTLVLTSSKAFEVGTNNESGHGTSDGGSDVPMFTPPHGCRRGPAAGFQLSMRQVELKALCALRVVVLHSDSVPLAECL